MKKVLVHALHSILLFLILNCCPQNIYATHIVGGEMNYRCLGNDQYEISLTIFRDCDTGVPWFDNPASIGIFDGQSNAYISTQFVNLNNAINDTLDIYLPDSCLIVPNNAVSYTHLTLPTILRV